MRYKTSIIILSYNTLDLLKLCIESIRAYTEAGTYEMIVVENASEDGSAEWLKTQPDLICVYNEENQGFPKGCNQGLEIATGTELLLLNSDTVVTKDWLFNLRRALYSSDAVGAVSCVTNYCSNLQQIEVSYKSIEEMFAFAASYNKSNPTLWEKRTKLVGFCYLFKREVFEAVGFLDEQFSPGNFEDDDYSLRILQNGYDLLLCHDTFIHHFGSEAFKKKFHSPNEEEVIERYSALLSRNQGIFFEKWQVPQSYNAMAPEELRPYLRQHRIRKDSYSFLGQKIAVLIRKTTKERYDLLVKSLYAAKLPEGFVLEIFPLLKEQPYAKQVNEIITHTDAKIKIFINDEVFLAAPLVIEQLWEIFQDPSIGMVGIVGSRLLALSGSILDAPELFGSVYMPMQGELKEIRCNDRRFNTFVTDVRFLLPSFFATNCDISWDEAYSGQYYALLSYCRAVKEQGQRIVAALPEEIWCAYQMQKPSLDITKEDRRHYFAFYHLLA